MAKMMTVKQAQLLKEMYQVMDYAFDYGTIGKKSKYYAWEASKLISLNQDIYYLITSEGQCTFKQYRQLTEIAGRQPKQKRECISNYQAHNWILQYSKKNEKLAV